MAILKPWRVLGSRTIFSDEPHISLSAQDVELPDGRVVPNFYQLESRPSCAVVATDDTHRFVMLRQYKHGARKVCLTFPGGRLEAGENLSETAQRELREETGFVATCWRSLGCFPIHANQGVGIVELFRAEGARQIATPHSGDLEEMEVTLIDQAQALSKLASGEIALLGDAAALALALLEARSRSTR